MHLGVPAKCFPHCSMLVLTMRRSKTGLRGNVSESKKVRRSRGLVELRYTSMLLCSSKIAPFFSSLLIRNWLWQFSEVRHGLIRSGIPWKCTFYRPATSIICPPPPPLMSTNGQKCRPDIPTAQMTRILSPDHVEFQPRELPAGPLFHTKAFSTAVRSKEKRQSRMPMVVAAWKCVMTTPMAQASGCAHVQRQRSFHCPVLWEPIWFALMRFSGWNRPWVHAILPCPGGVPRKFENRASRRWYRESACARLSGRSWRSVLSVTGNVNLWISKQHDHHFFAPPRYAAFTILASLALSNNCRRLRNRSLITIDRFVI